MFLLAKIRLSTCLTLAALTVLASFVTWHFMVAAALDGRMASVFDAVAWLFWMIALAVVFIWACWVKTETGWRWRWQRF